MTTTPVGERVAASGTIAAFIGWVTAHIQAVNGALQTVLLLVSIGSALAAWRYHAKRTPK